ncbi:hypothetical protein H0H92_015542 [Tricholoma furcatifolium]|nr:hypothetical protein H0H92_015542 [Tricholoma furcatifolium]
MAPLSPRLIFAFFLAINALLWSKSRYAVPDSSLFRDDHSLVRRISSELLYRREIEAEQILRLDENVAGVTFLAFGNGSPDVFSTFSAMRANSGSLAIGELIGAASFIVSCVVGSMCITKEFQVERRSFLRDVGFFTVAVSVLLAILWDSTIQRWEAGLLVALYVTYVFVVVMGAWWDRRQERKRINGSRVVSGDDPVPVPYSDADDESTIAINISSASPTLPHTPVPSRPRIDTNVSSRSNFREGSSRSRSRTPSPSPHAQLPSFSLVGALEFAQVVGSLRREAAAPSLSMFDSPVTPYAGGHYHSGPGSRHRTPRTSLTSRDDPWDIAEAVALDNRPRSRQSSPMLSPNTSEEPRSLFNSQSSDYFSRSPPVALSPIPSSAAIPSIIRTSASPTSSEVGEDSDDELFTPRTKRQRIRHVIRQICYALFPTLHHFKTQSILNQAAGILAAPAVLLLTLTLPVVVTPYKASAATREKIHQFGEGRLIEFEEEGEARALIAEEVVLEDLHLMKFNKWLMAVQCALAPLFCVAVLLNSSHRLVTYLLAAALGGCTAGILVLAFADQGDHPTARFARCCMGFLVAMVWIMAIADEIVMVLETFGFIFGLSDALIGLTLFAIGNSLADLVANMTVARFAPIMGFSACFGGPMLNILLGVGVSGSYITSQTSTPYKLHFSTTLLVSCIGLLFLLVATLIYVPFHDYYLTRRWGILLVTLYAILMTTNVIVELKSEAVQLIHS